LANCRKLKKSTLQSCWDETRNLLSDTPEKNEFSQHANVMAVLVDLLPAANEKELMQRVALDTA
jgi:hypothetical protein